MLYVCIGKSKWIDSLLYLFLFDVTDRRVGVFSDT